MVIISALCFPQESANKVGKRFLEIAPPPDYMSMKGPYIKGTEQGIRAIEIFELDETKLAVGLDYVTQRSVSYFGIPGFTYETNVYFEAQESLKLIGLA
ncbi:hypothetical protein DSCA_31220 [Desulfosarcina alkanivorans]|uniref:Uncharacterized protein n=1 Tax=Desulfosarcina alkanivorans TaxID=571177 RepID=A0A5K7YHQ2_9BACT|nr:hypothetical protein [Desulfosarcina alkanivorans]BBO69192.1 hypothetical protein DSCA_31220 [Desulfosarcina alkanivorans]